MKFLATIIVYMIFSIPLFSQSYFVDNEKQIILPNSYYLQTKRILFDGEDFYIFSNYRDSDSAKLMKIMVVKIKHDGSYELLPQISHRPYLCMGDVSISGDKFKIFSYAGNGNSKRPSITITDNGMNILEYRQDSSQKEADNTILSTFAKTTNDNYVIGDAIHDNLTLNWTIEYKIYDSNLKLKACYILIDEYNEQLSGYTFEQFYPLGDENCFLINEEYLPWERNINCMIVNDSAEILDSFYLFKNENMKFLQYNASIKSKDDNYIIALNEYATDNLSTGKAINSIRKYGLFGSLVWEKSEESDSIKYIRKILELENGHLVCAGTIMKATPLWSNSYYFYFVEFDNKGNKITEKTWGETGSNQLYDIVEIGDGHYMVAGNQRLSGVSNIYCAEISNKVGVVETRNKKHDISISPNPARDYININLAKEMKAELSLLDASGKQIKIYNNIPKRIDVRHLSPGAYYLYIQNKETARSIPFIIER